MPGGYVCSASFKGSLGPGTAVKQVAAGGRAIRNLMYVLLYTPAGACPDGTGSVSSSLPSSTWGAGAPAPPSATRSPAGAPRPPEEHSVPLFRPRSATSQDASGAPSPPPRSFRRVGYFRHSPRLSAPPEGTPGQAVSPWSRTPTVTRRMPVPMAKATGASAPASGLPAHYLMSASRGRRAGPSRTAPNSSRPSAARRAARQEAGLLARSPRPRTPGCRDSPLLGDARSPRRRR